MNPTFNPTTIGNRIVHAQTMLEYDKAVEQGLYYSVSKEIASFIQIYNDEQHKDAFSVLNDATLTGFKLFFHFDSTSGLLADENYINSALAYLKRIGHDARYRQLQRFIVLLSKINSYCPWMFQDLQGLQDVYSMPFSNVHRTLNLNIDTLETIDGKMTALFQMYRNIVWDDLRGVWVLPVNLRRFSMSVYVYDYRMFSSSSETVLEFLQNINNTDIRNINHILFDLGLCEFTNESGKSYFENISNNANEYAKSNISIKCENVSTSSLFKTMVDTNNMGSDILSIKPFVYSARPSDYNPETSSVDADTPSWLTKVKDRLLSSTIIKQFEDQYQLLKNPDTWKRELGNLVDRTTEEVIQAAESQVGRLFMGNVNGFGLDDILNMGRNGMTPTGEMIDIYMTEKRTKSRGLDTKIQTQMNLDDLTHFPSEDLD